MPPEKAAERISIALNPAIVAAPTFLALLLAEKPACPILLLVVALTFALLTIATTWLQLLIYLRFV